MLDNKYNFINVVIEYCKPGGSTLRLSGWLPILGWTTREVYYNITPGSGPVARYASTNISILENNRCVVNCFVFETAATSIPSHGKFIVPVFQFKTKPRFIMRNHWRQMQLKRNKIPKILIEHGSCLWLNRRRVTIVNVNVKINCIKMHLHIGQSITTGRVWNIDHYLNVLLGILVIIILHICRVRIIKLLCITSIINQYALLLNECTNFI